MHKSVTNVILMSTSTCSLAVTKKIMQCTNSNEQWYAATYTRYCLIFWNNTTIYCFHESIQSELIKTSSAEQINTCLTHFCNWPIVPNQLESPHSKVHLTTLTQKNSTNNQLQQKHLTQCTPTCHIKTGTISLPPASMKCWHSGI